MNNNKQQVLSGGYSKGNFGGAMKFKGPHADDPKKPTDAEKEAYMKENANPANSEFDVGSPLPEGSSDLTNPGVYNERKEEYEGGSGSAVGEVVGLPNDSRVIYENNRGETDTMDNYSGNLSGDAGTYSTSWGQKTDNKEYQLHNKDEGGSSNFYQSPGGVERVKVLKDAQRMNSLDAKNLVKSHQDAIKPDAYGGDQKDIKVFQGSANTKFVPSGGNKIGAFKMKR
tara:strand:- start:453 stop:1133 length:681 start_codon:yes stop_codon:yes gene_type:complete